MPVFPAENLNSQKICESYNKLLQIYNGNIVLDGTGSQKQFLNITASYVLNSPTGSGTPIYTGSYYPITASWANNASYSITASYASNFGNSITQSFSASIVWTFQHNLGDKYVIVQTVDDENNQLVPEIINLFDDNTAIIGFSVPTSGTAIATRGGVRVLTGSYGYYNLQTGSTYPITASWAIHTQTSSYIQVTGVSYPVRRIYNNYNIVRTTDYTILCDATSGEFNVKLPNPVGNTNIYNIKKIDTTGHRINLTVTNSSYIDYELTQSIAHKGTNITVQSDGTNQYWIL